MCASREGIKGDLLEEFDDAASKGATKKTKIHAINKSANFIFQ